MEMTNLQKFQIAINTINLIECGVELIAIYFEHRSLRQMRL